MKKKIEYRAPRGVLKKVAPEVTRVCDSDIPIAITVRQSDCKKGKKLIADKCPMALAVRRQLKVDKAVIGVSYSYVIKGDTAVRFLTSQTLAREIVSNDRHKDFRPGEYLLPAVPKSQRSVAVRRRYRSGPSGKHYHVIVHKRTSGVRSMR